MLKKRIPTIIGLLLLIIGAFGGVMFVNQSTDFLPRAAPEYAPQKVKITNLTENGFTVSWITQEPSIGFVKHGESAGNLSVVVVDERDNLTGKSNEYRTHVITVQNLKPATQYYFKLGSYKNQLYDNNGQPFELTTPSALQTPPPADTAYGTVITAADTPAEGAIVYVSLDGATPVSGIVKQNGNWAVNLSTARTTDLQNYASYDPQTSRLDILVQPATGDIAKAITTTGNTKPVPTMTLGQTYDFSTQANPVEPGSAAEGGVIENAENTANSGTNPTPVPDSKFSMGAIEATEGEIDPTINIITLPKDGHVVDSVQPEIKGKAPANTTVVITVHSSQAYTDQVVTDESGLWAWTPPGNLEPGEHTLTVSYTDAEGILHKVTRQFVVNAAEAGEPSYSATPSATPVATPTPRPTATPRPTTTPQPTATPRTTSVATQSAEIVAGATGPTIVYLLAGFGIITAGYYLTRKSF